MMIFARIALGRYLLLGPNTDCNSICKLYTHSVQGNHWKIVTWRAQHVEDPDKPCLHLHLECLV